MEAKMNPWMRGDGPLMLGDGPIMLGDGPWIPGDGPTEIIGKPKENHRIIIRKSKENYNNNNNYSDFRAKYVIILFKK